MKTVKTKAQILSEMKALAERFENSPTDETNPDYISTSEWLNCFFDIINDFLDAVNNGEIKADNETKERAKTLREKILNTWTPISE